MATTYIHVSKHKYLNKILHKDLLNRYTVVIDKIRKRTIFLLKETSCYDPPLRGLSKRTNNTRYVQLILPISGKLAINIKLVNLIFSKHQKIFVLPEEWLAGRYCYYRVLVPSTLPIPHLTPCFKSISSITIALHVIGETFYLIF